MACQRSMYPRLFLELFTQWPMLVVSGVVMVLIPLISYVSSLRPRRRRRRFTPPAETALKKGPEALGE